MSHVHVCAKWQQINHYKNNVIHFFFKVDPNRSYRLFRIKKNIIAIGKVFFLSYKLFPKFKIWISFVVEWCAVAHYLC